MKTSTFIIFLCISLLASVSAEEPRAITTLSGERFDKATVTAVNAYGISVSHEHRRCFVPFTNLPEDIRKQYGYDPAKVAAADAAAAAAQRAERTAAPGFELSAPVAKYKVQLEKLVSQKELAPMTNVSAAIQFANTCQATRP